MGLLGGSFKTSKFKNLAKLAISRIAILKNQHKARFSYARSDVVELLKLGQQDRALLRVEYVIKEQHMLDVFTLLEIYLNHLTESITLIQKNTECPDELKEATSSLIFASSRCGEFPELLHIREMLSTRFGKEFATQAVELSPNCSVNPKMIQKFSSRKPNLEIKLKLLNSIASENGITLPLEDVSQAAVQEKLDLYQKQEHRQEPHRSAKLNDHEKGDDTHHLQADIKKEEDPSELVKARKKNKNIATAEEEVFQRADYAAEAAKSVVLSTEVQENKASNKMSHSRFEFQKIDPIARYNSEPEGADATEELKCRLAHKQIEGSKGKAGLEKKPASSRGLDMEIASEGEKHSKISNERELLVNRRGMEIVYNEEDKSKERREWATRHDLSDRKTRLSTFEKQQVSEQDMDNEKTRPRDDKSQLPYQSQRMILLNSTVVPSINTTEGKSSTTTSHRLGIAERYQSKHSDADRKGLSVRTRRA